MNFSFLLFPVYRGEAVNNFHSAKDRYQNGLLMLLPRAFLGCRRLVVSLPLLAVASHYYKSLAICLSGELRFYDLLTAPSECIEVDVVVWSPENVQVTPSLQQQCKSMTH